jgi:hypothetical protein
MRVSKDLSSQYVAALVSCSHRDRALLPPLFYPTARLTRLTVEELVEAARAEHGGVDQLGAVGGGDDKHVPPALKVYGRVGGVYVVLIHVKRTDGTRDVACTTSRNTIHYQFKSNHISLYTHAPFLLPDANRNRGTHLEAVHLGQQLVYHALAHAAPAVPTCVCDKTEPS